MLDDIQRVPCPNCGARLVLKSPFPGKRVKCPKCARPFVASAAEPEPLDPGDSPDEEDEDGETHKPPVSRGQGWAFVGLGVALLLLTAGGVWIFAARGGQKPNEVAKSPPQPDEPPPPTKVDGARESKPPAPVPAPPERAKGLTEEEKVRAMLIGTWTSIAGEDGGKTGGAVNAFDANGKVCEHGLLVGNGEAVSYYAIERYREGKVSYKIDTTTKPHVIRILQSDDKGVEHLLDSWSVVSIEDKRLVVKTREFGLSGNEITMVYVKTDPNPRYYQERAKKK